MFLTAVACSPIQDHRASKVAVFATVQATEVFAAGYAGITEKYIDHISVEDIAIEGLRGLAAIDPSLTVNPTNTEESHPQIRNDYKKNSSAIVIRAQGKEVISETLPAPDDVNNWAALTAKIVVATRKTSPELQSSTMESLYEAVFDGAISNLDIFSRYSGAEEALKNRNKRNGFGGIGVHYKIQDSYPVLTNVLPNTPAEMAKLQKGDSLTHVDGNKLKGLEGWKVSALLHGPIHTELKLTFIRAGIKEAQSITLKRAHIFPVTITQNISNGIVALKITSFNQNTARSLSEKLKKAQDLLGYNMKGLVLDMRGNPGGLLKQSVKVADFFLTQGKIISTRGRHVDSLHQYEAGGSDLALGLPIAILMDGETASAAEVVAAALQDRNRAVIVGTASFGKGSVQTVLRLPNDGEITLTWSRLITPAGYMFHGFGVHPGICTSSLEVTSKGIIKKTKENSKKIKAILANWLNVFLDDREKYAQLTKTCTSQRRSNDLELRIAQHLIDHPVLYARALGLSAIINEAHQKR